MQTLWQDLRLAVRMLRMHSAYTALAVATLALGIGANTAIFSAINGVFLRPLPYANSADILVIEQPAAKLGPADHGFSVLELEDYRNQAASLASVDEYHSMSFTLYGQGDPARVTSGVVSAQYFDDLGVRPILGRSFRAGEDAIGAPANAILSYEFWKSKFAGDPNVVGRTFTMNDKVHTIVGVLPPLPKYPDANDIYIPAGSCPFRSAASMMSDRAMRMVGMFARVRPGVTAARAQSELLTVSARLHAQHPEAYPAEDGLVIRSRSLESELTRAARPTFFALLGMTAFLLLIACANVANLTLARQLRRTREMAMRIALGAGQRRLLRQLITESTVLALLGGAAGLSLAWAGLGLLRQLAGRFTPHTGDIQIDAPVLLFTLVISVITGLVFGALPALPQRKDLAQTIRDGGAMSASGDRGRLRNLLVVSQVAIACVLLIAAGLLARTLVNLRRIDPGYDASKVVTALVSLNWSTYTDSSRINGFADQLIDQLREAPGVAAVGIAGALPLDGHPAYRNRVMLEQPGANSMRTGQVEVKSAGGDYFRAIATPIMSGRDFSGADRNQQVAIVSQTAAQELWPGTSPIGERLSGDSGRNWFTVVGVVGDVRQHDLTSEVGPVVYVPFERQSQSSIRVLVRGAAGFGATEEQIRAAVRNLDAMQTVSQVQTLESLRTSTLASPQLTTLLSLCFALVALLLTAAGLAGVMAFSVAQRNQELGIRLALGAAPGRVVGMVVREGMALVGAGLAIGTVGALVATRSMSGLLFGVRPADSATYVLVSIAIGAVTLAACFLPARRVTRIDPVTALHSI